MGYTHTNSRGSLYYLNSKDITLRGGRTQTIFYFSKDERPEHCDLPDDREVSENNRTGLPIVKKKAAN